MGNRKIFPSQKEHNSKTMCDVLLPFEVKAIILFFSLVYIFIYLILCTKVVVPCKVGFELTSFELNSNEPKTS